MAVKWSVVSPRVALTPGILVTAVAFFGSILWTIYLSFSESRRFPDYTFAGTKQYERLFHDAAWLVSLRNLVIFGIGSLVAILLGFILAALVDKQVRAAGVYRTIFLYPLAVSLIVTGIVWRWLFDPGLGVENFLRTLGWTDVNFHWLTSPQTVMYGIILASVWQHTGFFMALLIAGLKGINPDIWRAGRLDGAPFWRFYIEIIIPMMKFTFLTCAILIAVHVVRAYDIIVAMTNGGPANSSFLPAYFTINAYWKRSNLGYASAAATIMLLMTLAAFLPFLVYTLWQRRKAQ